MCPLDDASTPATEPANTAAVEEPAPAPTEAPAAAEAATTSDTPDATAEPPHYSIIETWVSDLIGNIAHLRETEPFNILRAAIEDLKSRL